MPELWDQLDRPLPVDPNLWPEPSARITVTPSRAQPAEAPPSYANMTPQMWDALMQGAPPSAPSLWPDAQPPERDAFEAAAARTRAPYRNLPAPGSSPLGQFADFITSQPSWLERATEQSEKDRAAFQAGGVPGLMADTTATQELAGGFGGTTIGAGGIPFKAVKGAAGELTGGFAPATAPVRGNTQAELAALQKSALTAEEQQVLHTLGQKYPEFRSAAKFLHPTELKPMLTENNVQQMSRLLEVLPNAAEMSSVAKMGAPKQGWYRGSTQALIDVFGKDDAPRFAALLAATSPQNSVEMNLLNSLNIWKNWTAAGRPTDPRAIKEIMGRSVTGTKGEESVLDAWVNNTNRALSAEDPLKVTLSGPKVDSFYHNLADDVYRVTNDAWMANVMAMNQDLFRRSPTAAALAGGNPGMSPGYAATSSLVRRAGQRADMLPLEGQETIWSVAKPLMEKQAESGLPARELLQRGLITAEDIRGTPDFATLLKDPANRQILEQSGYGAEIEKLRPFVNQNVLPTLSTADQNNILNVAKRLEELKGSRERESRSYTALTKPKENLTTANATWEQVPGRGTGHLEHFIDAPQATRENFSAPIANMLADIHGNSILHQNLGFKTVPGTPATGAFVSTPGMPPEINPVRNYGFEVSLKGRNPEMTAYDQTKAQAANAVAGSMTAQLGTPYHALVADPAGTNLFIPLDKKAPAAVMAKAATKYAGEPIGFADTGKGTSVLDLGSNKLPLEKREDIGAIFGNQSITARSAATDTYFDLEKQWKAGVGSRQVTEAVLKQLNALKAGDFKRLDSANVQRAAGDLHDYYELKARTTKGAELRPDLMNYLRIIRDKGLAGLKQALDDPKQSLPVLLALGATGVLAGQSKPQAGAVSQ